MEQEEKKEKEEVETREGASWNEKSEHSAWLIARIIKKKHEI